MPDVQFSDLLFLTGAWAGSGHAEYPTISPADYRDQIVFTSDHKHSILHYVQQTWKVREAGDPEPLFWESGFIIDKGNSIFEVVSAQQSGRMEVLRGKAAKDDRGEVVLDLHSETIVNDERMLHSQRVFRFYPDRVEYELKMSTKANPNLQRHASAMLTRKDGEKSSVRPD